MNRKGFTLIEIMAVIIILSVIALVAFPAIESNIRYSREETYKVQLKQICKGGKDWGLNNIKSLNDDETPTVVSLGTLQKEGYVEYDIKNPLTGEYFEESVMVNIFRHNNDYVCEVDESTID